MKLLATLLVFAFVVYAVAGQSSTTLDWTGQWTNNNGGPYSVGGYFNVCLDAVVPGTNIRGARGFFGTFGVTTGTVNLTSNTHSGTFLVAGIPTSSYPTSGIFSLTLSSASANDADQNVRYSGWYAFNTNLTAKYSWSGEQQLLGSQMTGGYYDCLSAGPQAISHTVAGSYQEIAANVNNASYDVCVSVSNGGVRTFQASYSGNGGGYQLGLTYDTDHTIVGDWADGSGQGYLIGRLFSETNLVIYRTPSLSPQSNNLYTSIYRSSNNTLPTQSTCGRNAQNANQFIPNPPAVSPDLIAGSNAAQIIPSFVFLALVALVAALF